MISAALPLAGSSEVSNVCKILPGFPGTHMQWKLHCCDNHVCGIWFMARTRTDTVAVGFTVVVKIASKAIAPCLVAAAMSAPLCAHPTVWEPGKPTGPSSSQKASSSASGSRTSSAGSLSSGASSGPIDQLIVVGTGLGQVRTVSPEFVEQVRAALRSLPAEVRTHLFDRGCRIHCHPTVADRPFVMKATGQGWPKGFPADWKYGTLGGTFRGGAVTLGEYKVKDNGEYSAQSAIQTCARHECGHAIDHYYGGLSDRDEFKQAYDLDRSRMTDEQRSHVGYWLPDKHHGSVRDGRQEAFAEIIAAIYGTGENKDERKMFDVFPNCVRVVRTEMQEVMRR